jgi:choline dehydrogenase-like flavoprotein
MEHPHLYGEGYFFGSNGLPDSKFYRRHHRKKQRIVGFLNIRPEVRMREHLLNLSMCLRPAGGRTDKTTRAIWRAAQETDGGPAPTQTAARRFVLDVRSEQAPNPESRITLSSKKDSLGQPRVDLSWRVTALDKYSVRRSQEILAQDFARSRLGRFRVTLEDSDKFPKKMEGGCHHLGTTRMHADPRQGIVDANCRVHGAPNLYIGGSSVFTTGSAANPTLTIVALALRMAAHLRRELEA